MVQLTQVNDFLSVAGQIDKNDIAEFARQGYRAIINNRPDGEEPGQLTHEEAAAEAAKHGIEYHYLPIVTSAISKRDVAAQQNLVLRSAKPVVAHCRSGTRCYLLWQTSRALFEGESGLKLVAEAAIKGYDLRMLPGLVEKLETEG
jgi:sulfide:quinone oxidoreductase